MSATIEILIYRGEKLLGKREFQGELVTIGTAADSSLRFVGVPGVAEHHAMVWVENGGLTVAPSGGTPILWNGAPVSVARPAQTDFVSVGPLRLQMRLHGAAAVAVAPAPPPAAPARRPHEEEDDEPRTLVVSQGAVRKAPAQATPQGAGMGADGGIDKLLGMLEMELAGTRPYVALPDGSPELERVDTRSPAPGDFEEATTRAPSPRSSAPPVRVEETAPSPRGRQEPVFFPIGVDPRGPTAVAPAPRPPTPPPVAPPPAPMPAMPAPPPEPPPARAAKAPKAPKAPKPSLPVEEPAPRRQRQMPTDRVQAIAPPPDPSAFAHEHDEHDDEEEDEARFVEPFSLLEQISADAGVAGGELALQVTVVRNRKLAGYVTLDRGGHFSPFWIGRAVVQHRADGRAELTTAPQRTIRLRQSPSDPAQEVGAAGGSAVFAPGGSAIVRDGNTDLVVSFIRRPVQGKDRGGTNTTVGATYGGGSLVVHMTVALVLTILFGRSASLERAAQAHLGEEPPEIEVGVTPAEPPPPPPPPPPEAPPQPVPTPTATPVAAMPSVRTAVRRAAGPVGGPANPNPAPPQESQAEQALAALESMSTGASSSSTLREAIGSIDAAASSGGANAVFRVAGPVGQLPGGAVRIGRAGGGGGGPIETRDLNQVTKGGAIGGVGPVQGTRNVRGRVSGAGSRLGGQGTIDRAAVQRVILSHQGQIAACYERALLRDPGLAGRVVMAWSITPSGGVGNVSVGQSSLSNSAVTSCISAAIRGWRFPQPSGGSVTVTFPYVFRPVGL